MTIKQSIVLVIAILFLGFALACLFVYTQYNQTKDAIENRVFAELSSRGDKKSQEIESHFMEWQNGIEQLRSNTTLLKAMLDLRDAFNAFKAPAEHEQLQRSDLTKYLQTNVLPVLEKRQANATLETLLPDNARTLALQDIFIASNPKPFGDKEYLNAPKSNNSYSRVHSLFHSFLLTLREKLDVDDLLLIDIKTGNVVYTVEKEIDFATNLSAGFMKESNLAALYNDIKGALQKKDAKLIDYQFYLPSLAEPKAFIGLAIYQGDELVGILAAKVGLKYINAVMQEHKKKNEEIEDSFLVGENLLMHSNSALYVKDPDTYLKNLASAGYPQQSINKIKAYNSTALIQKVPYHVVLQGLTGTYGVDTTRDEMGREILISFTPVRLANVRFAAIQTVDKAKALLPIRLVAARIVATIVGLFILVVSFSLFLLRVNLRLEKAKSDLEIYAGQLENVVEERTNVIKVKNQQLEGTIEELKNTQSRLVTQEKLASLGALTAGVAHEIKNPLNFINNFAALALKGLQTLGAIVDKYQTNYAEADQVVATKRLKNLNENITFIIEQGKRTDGIVQRMMDHSRPHSNEETMTDINALIQEYLDLSFHALRAKDPNFILNVEKDFDRSIPQSKMIAENIAHALTNLFNNAFYAVNQKKKSLGDAYAPLLLIKTRREGNMIKIHVRDNGTGMSEMVKAKLFTPFFTTKAAGEGAGLGLSLCHDIIVQEHHGSIVCESTEGEFTEFIVTLPIKSPQITPQP